MKKILFLITLLTSFSFYSQKKTGLVHYGEIQSFGMGAPIGPDYNALLIFNNTTSLYITRQDSLEGGPVYEQKNYRTASGGGHSQTNSTNPLGFLYYNDLKGNLFFSRDVGFNYIKEPTPNINWEITLENKQIGDYKVYKALADFRGRSYTAWFTTQIPLPLGPWKLQGLPGLILEAYDTDKEIYWYFKELEYPTEKAYLLKPITNKKPWISVSEYRSYLLEALKNAQISGRMGAESAGVPLVGDSDSDLLRFYIENFEEVPIKR